MGYLVFIIVVVTTIWVGADASSNRITSDDKSYSWKNGAPAWILGCLLLWIVFFPYYLVRRNKVLGKRPGQTVRKDEAPWNQASPVTCPQCGFQTAPGDVYCYECGVTLEDALDMTPHGDSACSKCGTTSQEGAKFCGECGNRLVINSEDEERTSRALQVPLESSKPSAKVDNSSSANTKTGQPKQSGLKPLGSNQSNSKAKSWLLIVVVLLVLSAGPGLFILHEISAARSAHSQEEPATQNSQFNKDALPAAEPKGMYVGSSEQWSGLLRVQAADDDNLLIRINTTATPTQSGMPYNCSFIGTATFSDGMLAAGEDENGCSIRILLEQNRAVVEDSGCQVYCGQAGWLSGTYRKTDAANYGESVDWTRLKRAQKAGAIEFPSLAEGISFDGWEYSQLGFGQDINEVAVSPLAGDRYLLVTPLPNYSETIHLVDIRDRDVTSFDLAGPPSMFASWSPNLHRLILASYYEENMDLYFVDLAAEEVRYGVVPSEPVAGWLTYDFDTINWNLEGTGFTLIGTAHCPSLINDPLDDDVDCAGRREVGLYIKVCQYDGAQVTCQQDKIEG